MIARLQQWEYNGSNFAQASVANIFNNFLLSRVYYVFPASLFKFLPNDMSLLNTLCVEVPMSDDLPPVSRTIRERRGPVTVIVNLTLPPWPALTPPTVEATVLPTPMPAPEPAIPLPAPPIDPAPPIAPDPVPDAPVHVCPVAKKSWINRSLGVVFLELADDARWFYKKVNFWLFALVGSAPDLYNAAVDNHILPGGHVPAPLEKFFNMIGFLGAAAVIVKARKKLQENS